MLANDIVFVFDVDWWFLKGVIKKKSRLGHPMGTPSHHSKWSHFYVFGGSPKNGCDPLVPNVPMVSSLCFEC